MIVTLNSVTKSAGCSSAPEFLLGIDVGSTTTKIALLNAASREIVQRRYVRHHACQAQCVENLLLELKQNFEHARIRAIFCGSGGAVLAEALGLPFIQEVVANALAISAWYPRARTAIELGGQDAKIIFFEYDQKKDELGITDMRMNGSCAGGTGAFIDEIAALLKIPIEQFNAFAAAGNTVYSISGRCGVYAKTDIQPLLNQGALKEDLALSSFHAIAKQSIGGLAQGLDIKAPVVFEGGPLTFNPCLISVFAERLKLCEEEVIIPDHPETIVAAGAALGLQSLFADESAVLDFNAALAKLEQMQKANIGGGTQAQAFFTDEEERASFFARHTLAPEPGYATYTDNGSHALPSTLEVYLGIDSGSTTTKFAFLDSHGMLVDAFYASNEGAPLDVAKEALLKVHKSWQEKGCELKVVGLGTCGYGELMFARAFCADCHSVETVAHARACATFEPHASFILDIGGQDMKAIWVDNGVISNVVMNEACSSGCGSFLENFAQSLGIKTSRIAEAAFRSQSPAELGSRCTVFMNSSIVTEQRNGKKPDDIMAGLCRSIIANVFTKVIRLSNLDSLGTHIVVQGGTFLNDAVLRAFEQYVGFEVKRAPWPGLMGAIGAALIAQEQKALHPESESSFIGWDALKEFSYRQQNDLVCPFCANHCNRSLIEFSGGFRWVTGNRCPRGEVIGNPKDETVRKAAHAAYRNMQKTPNLYLEREKLLLKDYPFTQVLPDQNTCIGIPRVLSFWNSLPFWKTLFSALGFTVRLSCESTRTIYENGLSAVTSDTICFPAKLVHGHLRDLEAHGVDRIFMPIITTLPSENAAETSRSMCAVVKGYPWVIQNSDNPETRQDIPFDHPLFHWFSDHDRKEQLSNYFKRTFNIDKESFSAALGFADAAQSAFRSALLQRGREVLAQVQKEGSYAVVLAGRPYHNDFLVNHELPSYFTNQGIAVLTVDSLPGATEEPLDSSLIDIVNNYHARMLSTAVIAAKDPHLQYVQIVSFGCGHDAYLSDEIVRLMKEAGPKTPLVIKIDESDNRGPLSIRTRSFIETIERNQSKLPGKGTLADPYPQKFEKGNRKEYVVLIPNTSHAFCRLISSVFKGQGLRTVALPLGRQRAIELGKRYVHNDICFPAQIVIGEALAALESGEYDLDHVAVATGKYVGDCRLTHYAALLRKALDDAGYTQVPILTNDDEDFHRIHPGFKMNLASSVRIAFCLPMIDALEELLRKIRPYETVKGSANRAFNKAMDALMEGLERKGLRGARQGFIKALNIMNQIDYDRTNRRPQILIVGEYLLNFHPGANHDIEDYLEANGFEIIEARMTDVIRKTYFYQNAQIHEYHVDRPLNKKLWYSVADKLFERAHALCDRLALRHPLYEAPTRLKELSKESDPLIHHTFDAGEGILIPAEILHHAKKGCRAFVILQPFGCLPNHVVGRGCAKKLKEIYPDAHILPLDYDPDVSFANIENRLQMLIMSIRTSNTAQKITASQQTMPVV